MAKQNILTNKKILWSSAGVLLTSGVMAGVLVPVLTSKDDPKEKDTKLTLSHAVLNAKTSDDTITAMQKLYGLEIKKVASINELELGELKSKYQSVSNLATFIFSNKNSYQTSFVLGKEQTTNLQEIVMIMSPKNVVRGQDNTSNWPDNQVDAQDQFNFLITFFEGKVVRVRKLNAKTTVANETKIFFKSKAYDLINLFYQFKNADPQASDFGYYNAYLDDKNNTQGLALSKKYLLTLKAEDSTVTDSDLTEVMFTKKSHNSATNKAVVKLKFSYQGLSITKTINDFDYREIYDLTLKAEVANKMADEVENEDINITNLPEGVSISNIEPSPDYPDGSVIKITFSGGTITSQNFPGLTSYQFKAQSLLENAQNSDFTITGQSQILPSAYNDKVTLLNQLKAKANAITNNNAKRKVKVILETATITFEANDQTGKLSFIIAIGKVNNTFTNRSFDRFNSVYQVNKRIDVEVARKTKPTIKQGSEWKNGNFVLKEDIIINPNDATLSSKVIDVKIKVKTSDPWDEASIVIVTIEVSSTINGTKTKRYKIEVEGFVDNLSSSSFSSIKENLNFQNIANKNVLPSNFNDVTLIRNRLRQFINKYKFRTDTKQNILKRINNFAVNFKPSDKDGVLVFDILFGNYHNKSTYRVTGFKMSN